MLSILREPHRGAIGYRMATQHVNHRFGMGYNKKRLQRVMRRYGLRCRSMAGRGARGRTRARSAAAGVGRALVQ